MLIFPCHTNQKTCKDAQPTNWPVLANKTTTNDIPQSFGNQKVGALIILCMGNSLRCFNTTVTYWVLILTRVSWLWDIASATVWLRHWVLLSFLLLEFCIQTVRMILIFNTKYISKTFTTIIIPWWWATHFFIYYDLGKTKVNVLWTHIKLHA